MSISSWLKSAFVHATSTRHTRPGWACHYIGRRYWVAMPLLGPQTSSSQPY
jgi:hypothetical protein